MRTQIIPTSLLNIVKMNKSKPAQWIGNNGTITKIDIQMSQVLEAWLRNQPKEVKSVVTKFVKC